MLTDLPNISISRLRRMWLFPLAFFQAYLGLTVILFFWGPWPWNLENKTTLIVFLMLAQLSIAVGYFVSWKFVKRDLAKIRRLDTALNYKRGIRFLKYSIIFSVICLVPTSLSRTGGLYPNFLHGLTDTGAAYVQNIERLSSGNAFVVVEYLRMLGAPFLIAVLPLTVVYWKILSNRLRTTAIFVIFTNLAFFLATGTNKGLADFIVTVPWFIVIAQFHGPLRIKFGRLLKPLVFCGLFVGFLQFFGNGQLQREGNVASDSVFNTGSFLLYADMNNAVSKNQSYMFRVIYEGVTRYVTQGYYSLSQSFDLEHSSTLGVGNSMFMARNFDKIFNTDYFTNGSLPGLLEIKTGWGAFSLWHSIYPWLASDFGFAGTILVMGVFGFMLGRFWAASLITASPKPLVMLYLLILLFFYIPANNQIFQSGETYFAFLILFIGFVARYLKKLNQLKISRFRAAPRA